MFNIKGPDGKICKFDFFPWSDMVWAILYAVIIRPVLMTFHLHEEGRQTTKYFGKETIKEFIPGQPKQSDMHFVLLIC